MTGEGIQVGLCRCCGKPVYEGEQRVETVEQATGPGAVVLLHRELCHPPAHVRRYL